MSIDSKLERLYRIMRDSEDVGVTLSDDVLAQITVLEEKDTGACGV